MSATTQERSNPSPTHADDFGEFLRVLRRALLMIVAWIDERDKRRGRQDAHTV